jgi:hypothetical protein
MPWTSGVADLLVDRGYLEEERVTAVRRCESSGHITFKLCFLYEIPLVCYQLVYQLSSYAL